MAFHMAVTILIADDEEAARERLVSALRAAWPGPASLIEAGNGVDAWDLYLEHEPAAVFLDVRMPGMTGIDVAERIGGRVPVVFVATPGDPSIAAFGIEGVAHLVKPVQADALATVLAHVQERLATQPEVPPVVPWLAGRLAGQVRRPAPLEAVAAGTGNTAHPVPVVDIVYFEAEGRFTRAVQIDGGEAVIRMPLKDLVALLDPRAFVQVHRGLVVGRRWIGAALRVGGDMVITLRDREERFQVSRHFQSQFGDLDEGVARSAA
jgi:DNA-binding LytR/AlgR family response regulator